jgi:hypothetical protein
MTPIPWLFIGVFAVFTGLCVLRALNRRASDVVIRTIVSAIVDVLFLPSEIARKIRFAWLSLYVHALYRIIEACKTRLNKIQEKLQKEVDDARQTKTPSDAGPNQPRRP